MADSTMSDTSVVHDHEVDMRVVPHLDQKRTGRLALTEALTDLTEDLLAPVLVDHRPPFGQVLEWTLVAVGDLGCGLAALGQNRVPDEGMPTVLVPLEIHLPEALPTRRFRHFQLPSAKPCGSGRRSCTARSSTGTFGSSPCNKSMSM